MKKEIVNQVQEAQSTPYRINPRRNTPRHILIKLKMTKHFLNSGMKTYSLPMVWKTHIAQPFMALKACYLGNETMVSALQKPFFF